MVFAQSLRCAAILAWRSPITCSPIAITLDLQLPRADGRFVLERLKSNGRTRHIPVHVISVAEKTKQSANMGAFAYLEKPVSKDALELAFGRLRKFLEKGAKRLLLVEDDPTERASIAELIGRADTLEIKSVDSGAAAVEELAHSTYDCVVIDLLLRNGMDGLTVLQHIKTDPRLVDLPVIVYTGKELTRKEEQLLKTYAESVIHKGDAGALERLLSDSALFLHLVEDRMPTQTREKLVQTRAKARPLSGKTILIIDDDVRNIFAMTGILEGEQMRVVYAENGRAGIQALDQHPDVDVVIMDVMMPEMDGYQTIKVIRNDPRFQTLPIIAITAKALKEDRDRCLAAGASDYLSKPVDPENLLSVIRLWIRQ